jgi:hypothetical protein
MANGVTNKGKIFFFFFFFFFFFLTLSHLLFSGDKKQTYKKTEVPLINADAILLHAVLAERCWAHAQQLNDEVRNLKKKKTHQQVITSYISIYSRLFLPQSPAVPQTD